MLRSPHPQTNLRAGAIAGLGVAVEANGIGSELRDVAAYIGIPPITMKPYLVALALISAVAVALTPVLTNIRWVTPISSKCAWCKYRNCY